MSRDFPTLSLDEQLSITREIAARHRVCTETLALARTHGRVLAGVNGGVAPQPFAAERTGSESGRDVIDLAFVSGQRLTPARVAMAAQRGIAALEVSRKPTVALLGIGDGQMEPGTTPQGGEYHDAMRPFMTGLLRADGLEPTGWPALPEDARQVEIAVRDTACAFDIVLITVRSATARTLAENVIAQFGQIHFAGAGNGAPALLGSLDQARVLVLPHDPVDALGTYASLVRTLVAGLQGSTEPPLTRRVRLRAGAQGSNTRFACLRLAEGATGACEALPVEGAGFDAILQSDALVFLPAGARASAGASADAWVFGPGIMAP